MTLSELENEVKYLSEGKLRPSKCWTDLVWQIVQHRDLDRKKDLAVVELDKALVECIAIAWSLKPITMKNWSTGRTLDWINKRIDSYEFHP